MSLVGKSTAENLPNRWTNAVMKKYTRASITSPSDLKYYIVSEILNPRLINTGGSGYPTTQKSFLNLSYSNQDLC